MKRLPLTTELEAVALKTVWFKAPKEAIANTIHFVAHVLTYGTFEDITILRKYLSQDDLIESIDHAPAGVFDPRSWAYWNVMIGRFPTPQPPKRKVSP